MSIVQKVAVVTGASRGLGQQVAIGLASSGIQVALVSRDESGLRETELAITRAGGSASIFPANITDPVQVGRIQQQAQNQFGPPLILVNAAGIFGPLQLIRDTDPELWIQTMMTNAIAPYLLCHAFVGSMMDHGWGRIINFSSAASLAAPGKLNSAYVVSKVALNQFTRQLAAELVGTGVTANVIHPGEVKTEMWADIRDAATHAGPAAEGFLEWARWVETTGGDPPHKTVQLILKLLSDESASINGQFFWIEDGLQAPLPSW